MRITFFAALAILATGCAEAQSPTDAPVSEAFVLADGRGLAASSDATAVDVLAWEAHPALVQASEAARAYWQGQDAGFDEEYRVMDVAEGSFTEPGAQQQAVLYLMSLWPRCCPKMGVAVVEDGRLVRHVVFEGVAQTLRGVPDLDGDGRDELVFTGSFGMGGDENEGMTLTSFRDRGLVTHGSASISVSGCASGRPRSTALAVRVLARPGPAFTVERFAGSCETDVWQADGLAQAFELDPPYEGGTKYVELPVR